MIPFMTKNLNREMNLGWNLTGILSNKVLRLGLLETRMMFLRARYSSTWLMLVGFSDLKNSISMGNGSSLKYSWYRAKVKVGGIKYLSILGDFMSVSFEAFGGFWKIKLKEKKRRNHRNASSRTRGGAAGRSCLGRPRTAAWAASWTGTTQPPTSVGRCNRL